MTMTLTDCHDNNNNNNNDDDDDHDGTAWPAS